MSNWGMRRGAAPRDPKWTLDDLRARDRARGEMNQLATDALVLREFLQTLLYVVAKAPIDSAKLTDAARRLAVTHREYTSIQTRVSALEHWLNLKARPYEDRQE